MERWQNKVAVVTGASSGIGAACAKEVLAQGLIVVGLARRLELMENELKASLPKEQQSRFHAIKCDVSKEEDILKAFAWIEQKLGGIDVLINNAGFGTLGTIIGENNSADMRAVIDTNVMGVAYCTREAFHSMKKRNVDGHIIMINSLAGHKVPALPQGSLNVYPASRFALTAMTKVLRQEFMAFGTGVKVTSISPGCVETACLKPLELPPEIPRLEVEDIANTIIYCLQTPPNVHVHEIIIKPVGEFF